MLLFPSPPRAPCQEKSKQRPLWAVPLATKAKKNKPATAGSFLYTWEPQSLSFSLWTTIGTWTRPIHVWAMSSRIYTVHLYIYDPWSHGPLFFIMNLIIEFLNISIFRYSDRCVVVHTLVSWNTRICWMKTRVRNLWGWSQYLLLYKEHQGQLSNFTVVQ